MLAPGTPTSRRGWVCVEQTCALLAHEPPADVLGFLGSRAVTSAANLGAGDFYSAGGPSRPLLASACRVGEWALREVALPFPCPGAALP